jgi:ferric-dicitrate binding protein FerR (iron transport regulator)
LTAWFVGVLTFALTTIGNSLRFIIVVAGAVAVDWMLRCAERYGLPIGPLYALRGLGAEILLIEILKFSRLLWGWPRGAGISTTLLLVAPLLAAAVMELASIGATAPIMVYRTDPGRIGRFAFSADTVIQLNSDSQLNARIQRSHVEVTLQRGEALFRAAEDLKLNVSVPSAKTVVLASGAEFLVHLQDDGRVEILVSHGRVVIEKYQGETQIPIEAKKLILRESQISTILPDGQVIGPVSSADVAHRFAWENRG